MRFAVLLPLLLGLGSGAALYGCGSGQRNPAEAKDATLHSEVKLPLKHAFLDNAAPSEQSLAQLLETLVGIGDKEGLRARSIFYVLQRSRSGLSDKQRAELDKVAALLFGPAVKIEGAKSNISLNLWTEQFLNFANGTEMPGLRPGASAEKLGIDSELLTSPLLLPMSRQRLEHYASAELPPSRTDLYVASIQHDAANYPEENETSSQRALRDQAVAEAAPVLKRPFNVDGQVAYLLSQVLDLTPRQAPKRVSPNYGDDGGQVAVLGPDPQANRLAKRLCGSMAARAELRLRWDDRHRILRHLGRSGIAVTQLDIVGCAASSLLISAQTSGRAFNTVLMAVSPDEHSKHAGALFVGFEQSLSVDSVGVSTQQGLYFARQTAGSGGFMTGFLVDVSRGVILLSAWQVPDGAMNYMLRTTDGPGYFVIRQSILTTEETKQRNAAPKHVMTALLELDRKEHRYWLRNVKVSRQAHHLERTGMMHLAQMPEVAGKLVCMELPRDQQASCEVSAKASLAEGIARQEMGDSQGAARVFGALNRKEYEKLSSRASNEDRSILLASMLEEVTALLASGQIGQMEVVCRTLEQAVWPESVAAEARSEIRLTCENSRGLAQRNLGSFAAAIDHFQGAAAARPDESAPIGNLIRVSLDGAQNREAASSLLEILFSPKGEQLFSGYQNLAFARAAAAIHHSPESLTFLIPKEQVNDRYLGMALAEAAMSAQQAGLAPDTIALADESLHYLGQMALLEMGPDLLVAYARARTQMGFAHEAPLILERVLDGDTEATPQCQARALELLSEIAEKQGNRAAAFQRADQAIHRLQLSMPGAEEHKRYFPSILGANRSIIERWFRLARKTGVAVKSMYQQSMFWQAAIGFRAPHSLSLPQAEKDECFVDYLKVEKEAWRFHLCADGKPGLTVLRAPYDDIVARVNTLGLTDTTLFGAVQRALGLDTKHQRLADVSALLLQGLQVEQLRRIFITPDAGLSNMPWAALVDPRGRYLIDHSVIAQYLPGGAKPNRAVKLTNEQLGIIASSGQVRDMDGNNALPALPGVTKEFEAITAAWRPGRIAALSDVSGEPAGTSWQQLLRSSAVIHIAAHGIRDALLPSRSFVILSDRLGNLRVLPRDLQALPLDRVRLAVLNVCASGFVTQSDSFGDVGFRTTLLAQGAGAVLDASWDVGDSLGATFAQRFYVHLRATDSIEDSYRTAVLAAKQDSADPGQWATYSLSVSHPDAVRFTL